MTDKPPTKADASPQKTTDKTQNKNNTIDAAKEVAQTDAHTNDGVVTAFAIGMAAVVVNAAIKRLVRLAKHLADKKYSVSKDKDSLTIASNIHNQKEKQSSPKK